MKTAPLPASLLVFGGSFNPVHWGHLLMAEEVREEFGYEKVVFVPTSVSPFKPGAEDAGPGHRLAMLELACEGNPAFSVSDAEISRGGLSYTVDTLRELVAAGLVRDKPGFLMGDDLVPSFSRWKEHEALAALARLIVGRRSPSASRLPPPFEAAANRLIPISSREIRERLASRRSARYLLPDPVLDYIVREGLYGSR